MPQAAASGRQMWTATAPPATLPAITTFISALHLSCPGGDAADIFPPCGVCRQVMQEFCAPSFMIYMGRSDGTYVAESLGAMLPYGFTADKYMK